MESTSRQEPDVEGNEEGHSTRGAPSRAARGGLPEQSAEPNADSSAQEWGGVLLQPASAAAFAYLSFMWGSTYLFIKLGIAYWPPILMASARNLVAAVFMLLVAMAMRRPTPDGWRQWWPPLAFGVINGSAFALIFWGEQFISSGQTAVLVATVPLFSLFLAWWWNGERPTWMKGAAVAVGLGGVLLATGHRQGAGFFGSDLERLLGQAAMLGAAVCYATSFAFGKRFFRADLYANTTLHLASSGVYLLLLSLLFDPPPTAAILTWPALGPLLYLAVPGSALAYLAMFYLIEKMSVVQTTYVTLLNPIVALLLGILFMGESLSALAVAGSALVVGGVWLVTRPVRTAETQPRRRAV